MCTLLQVTLTVTKVCLWLLQRIFNIINRTQAKLVYQNSRHICINETMQYCAGII